MGQSVRTVKVADADSPLDSPVAVTSWSPGRAVLGTTIKREKSPCGSVVAWVMSRESKVMSTTSFAPNPAPIATVRVVGGPLVFDNVSVASDARASVGNDEGSRETKATAIDAARRRRLFLMTVGCSAGGPPGPCPCQARDGETA